MFNIPFDKEALKAFGWSLLKVMGYQAMSAAFTAGIAYTSPDVAPKDLVLVYMVVNLTLKAGFEAWQQLKLTAGRRLSMAARRHKVV